jgi:hypothetical protein
LQRLEYPQPKLKLDIKSIEIETAGGYEGSFTVANAGGAELEGEIFLDSKGVVFYPSQFRGNLTEITYTLNLDSYKPGDVLQRDALVTSNGGETVIPITIRIIPPEIRTKEGHGISSLEDFYEYAEQSPVAARQLFNQWEFADWLSGQGYGHMELYEKFVTDPNKERAVDNFLAINGIKGKSAVKPERRTVTVYVAPGQTEQAVGEIWYKRLSPGYAEVRLAAEAGASWLSLGKDRVLSSDFDADGRAKAVFAVNPSELDAETGINAAYVSAETESGVIGGTYVLAVVRRHFKAELDRERYLTDGSGLIKISNNTGSDLMLEIFSADKHIKLTGRKYLVGAYAEIPFMITFSGFETAFRRLPPYTAEVTVRTAAAGKGFWQQVLKIRIGGY